MLHAASDKTLIEKVQKGSFLDDDGVTIGELFSEKTVFRSVKWSAGYDGNDEQVVQAKGETYFLPVEGLGKILFFKSRDETGGYRENVLNTTLTTRFRVSQRGGISITGMEAKLLNESTMEEMSYVFRHSQERNAVLDALRQRFKENAKTAKLEAVKDDPIKMVKTLLEDEKDLSNVDYIVGVYKYAQKEKTQAVPGIQAYLKEQSKSSRIASLSYDKINIMDGKVFYEKSDIPNAINSFQAVLKNSSNSQSVDEVLESYKKMIDAYPNTFTAIKDDFENFIKENPNSVHAKSAYEKVCKIEETRKAKIAKAAEEKRVQEHLAAERAQSAALRKKQEEERGKKAEEERLKKEKELEEKKKKEQEYLDKQKNGSGLDKAVKSLFNDLF